MISDSFDYVIRYYSFEFMLASIALLFVVQWFVGRSINREIVQQLAIPIVKTFSENFHHMPAFQTLGGMNSHLPSLFVEPHQEEANKLEKAERDARGGVSTVVAENTAHCLPLADEDDDMDSNRGRSQAAVTTSDGDSQTTTTTSSSSPSGLILAEQDPLCGYITVDQVWDYIYSESPTSYQLYASGHPLLMGALTTIHTIHRQDFFALFSSLFGITLSHELLIIKVLLPDTTEPMFYSINKSLRETTQIRKLDDVIGLNLQTKFDECTGYTIVTDTNEFCERYSQEQINKMSKKNIHNAPCSYPILEQLITYDKECNGAFSLLSYYVSDYERFQLTPLEDDDNGDHDHENDDKSDSDKNDGDDDKQKNTSAKEKSPNDKMQFKPVKCAYFHLQFDVGKVPDSDFNDDINNQVFINTHLRQILDLIFTIAKQTAKYRISLPSRKKNITARQIIRNPDPSQAVSDENDDTKKEDTTSVSANQPATTTTTSKKSTFGKHSKKQR